MPAQQQSTNTMAEELNKLIKQIAVMKTLPDADIDWINQNLEGPVLMKIREPLDQQFAAGNSQVPPPPIGAESGGGMGGGMDGGMGFPPVPGIRTGTDMSGGVDELRRILGVNAQAV